ncbi:MAG: alginate export family protein [candidate division Zixibacteria bacterium]|nr:alginate export family protein [candidate division Zixibacteria bacterium]
MKITVKTILIISCMLIAFSASALAETKFSYDGQIRLRVEFSNKSFAQERHAQQYNDLRTRLGFTFEPTDMAKVYIQFQDSRRLGSPSSGGLTSSNNVDLHQAYFELQCPKHPSFHLKGGRFEVNYGNQRVFGAVGWHNIGRSWEGLIASVRPENFNIDFFLLKKMEINSGGYNRDTDIFGAYAKLLKAKVDLFAFYELDADSNGYVEAQLKRFNIGTFYKNNFDNFDVTFQGNYQLGTFVPDGIPDSTVLDIAAFMINGEFGYAFEGKSKARVALGLDYTSGDDGSDTTKYKAYTNAYYTGHAYRGYFDEFLGSPMHGLIDIMLRAKGKVTSNILIKGDFHYFKAAENYSYIVDEGTTDEKTGLSSNIGYEFDLTLVRKIENGAVFTAGLSVFAPEEEYAGYSDKKMGMWSYLMWTVNF